MFLDVNWKRYFEKVNFRREHNKQKNNLNYYKSNDIIVRHRGRTA